MGTSYKKRRHCHIADIVQNFFLARTLTAGTIRMDPQFKQRAHREWFLDAIGKLRIAWYAIIDAVFY